MKKALTILILLFTHTYMTWADDVSSVVPTRQTLYNTIDGTTTNTVTLIGERAVISANHNIVNIECTTPPQNQGHTNDLFDHPITYDIPYNTTTFHIKTNNCDCSHHQYNEDKNSPAQVLVATDDTTHGTETGRDINEIGPTVTLTESHMSCCHIEAREDGNIQRSWNNTNDSRDTRHTHTDIIAIDTYFVVTAVPNDTNLGSVLGSGNYLTRSTAMLSATPKNGSRFVQWSDGIITATRTLYVACNTTLQAIFRVNPDPFIVRDTSIVHDTTYISVHDTIEKHDTVVRSVAYYEMNVLSDNPQRGVVSGNGRFPDSTTVEISAIPIEGYRFEQWQDGNSDNPRAIQLIGSDATYVATFEPSDQTIDTVQGDDDVTITAHNGQITVTNVSNRTVRLFDSMGRHLTTSKTHEGTRHFTLTASGVYLLQVDTSPARRVEVSAKEPQSR